MMCIVCSFLIFMTRPLAYILYANDFYEAWKYVPFLLVSSVLNCASGLLGPILSAKKNSKAMMWSAIVGAVANIIMNIVFVNLTGIQGATFATLVSSYIIYIIRKYAVGEDIYINNYYVIIVPLLEAVMIKYLIMDVDGTLTDGKIYMGPNGEAMKAFSIKDGYVVNYILKPAGIKPVIITARTSSIVQNRCKELGITEVYQGKTDKQRTLMDIVGDNNLSHCAYFGDDIIDINCMQPIKDAGGIVGCPADAVREVKQLSDYVCINKAGEGALREFTEWLITEKRDVRDIKRRVDAAVNYLQSIDVSLKDIGRHSAWM